VRASHGKHRMDGLELPTAIFFVLLSLTLGVMTWLAVAYPEAERIGVLRIPTTRGDRLFISLVMTAVIHLLWIAFFGTDALLTLPIGRALKYRACGSRP